MNRSAIASALVAALLSTLAGCQQIRDTFRPAHDASAKTESKSAPKNLPQTFIDYVDTDGFDRVFETALVNRDAVITIRTPNDKPDWTGRLNAWIAAWNMGKNEPRIFRGQIPVPNIDGDTLREFRLLVGALLDRVEDASKESVTWFREERTRSRRVELLRPYNLRFHMHADGHIHVIFFHGDHAEKYQQFLSNLTDCDGGEHWSRTIEYSKCKRNHQVVQNAQ